MRNKILKLAFRFSAFAFAVGMTGCDALDLAPIDTYGSGNFWTRKEHVIAYMDGIHKNFRDQIFQQQYVLGEARGGTSVPDVAVDGTSVSYQGIVNQALNAESPGITNFGNIYGCIANINIMLQKTRSRLYDRRRKRPIIWGKLTVCVLSITSDCTALMVLYLCA